MLPRFSPHYIADIAFADVKIGGQHPVKCARLSPTTDFVHLRFRELRLSVLDPSTSAFRMRVASVAEARSLSSLRYFVPHIVQLRSKEQVRRVHAGGIVAGVTDLKLWRYQAEGKYPRDPMRNYGATVEPEMNVFAGDSKALARPAGVRAPRTIRFGPKSLIRRRVRIYSTWHRTTPSVSAPRSFAAMRGKSVPSIAQAA